MHTHAKNSMRRNVSHADTVVATAIGVVDMMVVACGNGCTCGYGVMDVVVNRMQSQTPRIPSLHRSSGGF